MKRYELMYIIPSATTDEIKDGVINTINTFIEKNGGKIESTEKVGNKKLAYEIDKCTEGLYVLTYFEAETAAVSAITNFINITENVLRHIIVGAGK